LFVKRRKGKRAKGLRGEGAITLLPPCLPTSVLRGDKSVYILAILLIALGLVLLLIEIFLLPGFGAAGVPGVIFMAAGVIWVMTKNTELGLIYAGVTVGVTIPLSILALWLVPRTKIGKKMILESSEAGFSAPSEELKDLAGKSGKAVTPLRPSGTAVIEGKRVDVVSLGEFIDKGSEIEVIEVEGYRVVVQNVYPENG